MPTKLSVFNDALALLGQPQINSTDDPGEDARYLTSLWDASVKRCVEAGAWDFAKVLYQCPRSATVPVWGWSYYYTFPGDMDRMLFLSSSGHPRDRLVRYEITSDGVASDVDTVYLSYISNTAYTNPGKWSGAFAMYVSADLAFMSAGKLNPARRDESAKALKKWKADALSLDATQGPPVQRRHGSVSSAARGAYLNRGSGEQG